MIAAFLLRINKNLSQYKSHENIQSVFNILITLVCKEITMKADSRK